MDINIKQLAISAASNAGSQFIMTRTIQPRLILGRIGSDFIYERFVSNMLEPKIEKFIKNRMISMALSRIVGISLIGMGIGRVIPGSAELNLRAAIIDNAVTEGIQFGIVKFVPRLGN